MEQIDQAGAFYLSRLKFSIIVYQLRNNEYTEVDLIKLKDSLKVGERITMQVYLGRNEKLPARLVVEKVPAEVAAQKRRKLKTDKQNKRKHLSKRRLAFCDVNAYITNASEQELPSDKARHYYGLRWQIEIIFKAWKSVYHIDKIKNMKLQRFECIHYGMLIMIILTTRLLGYYKRQLYKDLHQELSELKMFKTIKLMWSELKDAVRSKKRLTRFIDVLHTILERTAIKDQKGTRLKPFDILNLIP